MICDNDMLQRHGAMLRRHGAYPIRFNMSMSRMAHA
jgi:hypothetical protein